MTTPAETPVLEARGLTKTYSSTEPPTEVLHAVDLTVSPGEFLAVMGASGSGKSTLLHTLGGMDEATTGEVLLSGTPLAGLDDASMSRIRLHRMGFVFQQAFFLDNLTIRDNVLLPAVSSNEYTDAEARTRVDLLLERFGLSDVAAHGTTEVSGGQLQRASIARALVTEPEVVFADEPTGALNSSMTREVMDTLSGVHAAGTTLVMVTHDPACTAWASRVVYLADGRITAELDLAAAGDPGEADRRAVLDPWLTAQSF